MKEAVLSCDPGGNWCHPTSQYNWIGPVPPSLLNFDSPCGIYIYQYTFGLDAAGAASLNAGFTVQMIVDDEFISLSVNGHQCSPTCPEGSPCLRSSVPVVFPSSTNFIVGLNVVQVNINNGGETTGFGLNWFSTDQLCGG